MIACRNASLSRLLCSIEFTSTTAQARLRNAHLSFWIVRGSSRRSRALLRGSVRLTGAAGARLEARRLRPGHYTLVIAQRRGHRLRILLRRSFLVR